MILVSDTGNKRNMQILKHFHLLNITKYLGEHQFTSLYTDVPPPSEGGETSVHRLQHTSHLFSEESSSRTDIFPSWSRAPSGPSPYCFY